MVYLKNEEKAKNILTLSVHEKQQLQEKTSIEKEEFAEPLIHFINQSEQYGIREELKEQLDWKYPYTLSCYIPTMTSVSKIKELEMEQQEIKDNKTIKILQETKIPEFLKEEITVSKAKLGTLLHLCLQKMNEKEEYDLEKIQHLIEDLVQKQLMTPKEAAAINPKDLYLYTKSELFNQLKCAKQICKEVPFYLDIEAKEMVKQQVDEKILVQGIIDLYYIDNHNHMVLVDYKTDFVKQEEELIIKYKKQLEIYKKALEEATGRKVDKVYIYSIYLQKCITIEG
ncbi:MAG: hypothetical protein HFJ27_02220 [Clostridia bacterium]|nr:hypothetical protein [Clostridia bacterium]